MPRRRSQRGWQEIAVGQHTRTTIRGRCRGRYQVPTIGTMTEPEADDSPLSAQLNTERLKNYWKTGAGGARIRWGTDGDLTRCHNLVTREAGADAATFDVWGYCQNLHKELFGRPNPRD